MSGLSLSRILAVLTKEFTQLVRDRLGMDRDPSGDHAAICAACATGPAFHAAAREESLAYRRVARQPSQVA